MATGLLKVDGHLPERISVVTADGISHSISKLSDSVGRVLWQGGITPRYIDCLVGRGGYINTGVAMNSNIKVVMNCEIGLTFYDLFGSDPDSTHRFIVNNNNRNMTCVAGSNKVVIQATTDMIHLEMDNSHVDINNTTTTFSNVVDWSSDTELYIFARNPIRNYSSMKLFNFCIYENNNLIREFQPCEYEGELGLWDKVTNTFYGDSTGQNNFSEL